MTDKQKRRLRRAMPVFNDLRVDQRLASLNTDGNAEAIGDGVVTYAKIAAAAAPGIYAGGVPRPPIEYRIDALKAERVTLDDTTKWSATNGSAAYDADNVRCYAGTTKRSIKLTPSGSANNAYMTRTALSAPVDLTDTMLYMRFYIHEGSGNSAWTALDTVSVYLQDNTGNNWCSQWIAWKKELAHARCGWWEVCQPMDNLTLGSCDISDIDVIRIRLDLTSVGPTPSVTFDQVAFYPEWTTPLYCMTFDDGYDEHYTCAMELAARGIPATFFIPGSSVGTTGDVTLSQLREMHEMGHLIANHSWSHYDWNEHTDAEMIEDFLRMADYLAANVSTDGAWIWATPSGRWPATAHDAVLGKYCHLVRVLREPSYTYPMVAGGYPITCRRLIGAGSQTVADAESLLDNVLVHKGVAVPVFHQLSGATLTDWRTHVSGADRLAAKVDAGSVVACTLADLLTRRT